jgi:hypothetical protein
MNPKLKEAIQTVLRADADRSQLNALRPEDFMFAHCLINYARAKQESLHLKNIVLSLDQGPTAQDIRKRFEVAAKRCFPRIEEDQIEALYEAFQQDEQSW